MKNFIFISLLFAMLLMAGCAGIGGQQQTKTTEKATDQKTTGNKMMENKSKEQKISKETVKFGAVVPLTGSLANLGAGIRDAMLLAVEDVNKAGGINGKMLELQVEDTGCDPGKAVPAVDKLVSVDKVIAIAGPTCSGESLATAQMLSDNLVPAVSESATSPDLTLKGGDYWFRVVPSDLAQGKVAAAYAREKLGAKRAAMLYLNNDWGVGLKEAFKNNFKEMGGAIAIEESMEKDTTDVRTQVTKIRALNVDTVYLACYPAECAVALKQMHDLGMKVNVIGADGGDDPTTLAQLGDAAEGFTVTIASATAASEDFKAEYNDKYGKEAGAYAAQAYDAVRVLAEAAKKGSGEDMKNALYGIDYAGASGPIKFDENGDLAASAVYDLKKWTGGQFQVLEQMTVDLSG